MKKPLTGHVHKYIETVHKMFNSSNSAYLVCVFCMGSYYFSSSVHKQDQQGACVFQLSQQVSESSLQGQEVDIVDSP